jgi:hypothetical protein
LAGTFELTPCGKDVAAARAHPLAEASGRLAGELLDGAVQTWLEDGGERIVLMWPRGFRARVTPLEVIDDHGRVVVRGGESLTVGGGFVKPRDATSPARDRVFALWTVTGITRYARGEG